MWYVHAFVFVCGVHGCVVCRYMHVWMCVSALDVSSYYFGNVLHLQRVQNRELQHLFEHLGCGLLLVLLLLSVSHSFFSEQEYSLGSVD